MGEDLSSRTQAQRPLISIFNPIGRRLVAVLFYFKSPLATIMATSIGIGLIGCGGIALANHVPGIGLCKDARIEGLCDANPAVLQRAVQQTGVGFSTSNYQELLANDRIHAVVIATPNIMHGPIALAAIQAGKHVLCEKPIAMNVAEAESMRAAAAKAGVRHMTAFTYRFVPAMRYIAHLVREGAIGTPYHFRAQRFQDWGSRNLAWRQVAAMAGTGELGDMLSHRIDFAHLLMGEFSRVVARLKLFIPERGGQPSDLDDWVSILGDFKNGATGVLESSKLITGGGEGGQSRDLCEVNGSDGTLIYELGRPFEVRRGRKGSSALEPIPVPREFLAWPGSNRDPYATEPLIGFRYDQDVEFVQAILEQRDCCPSFADGVRAQQVMDAAVLSDREQRWVSLS